MKPKNYTKVKKIVFGWTDKKNVLIHYKMLKFYVRHGMIVDKIHEIKSFKQSRCSKNYINFDTEKRNTAKKDLEKDISKR